MACEKKRCGWVKLSEPIYVEYHDNEWGRELHDDRALFELFSLETQASGLSWLTVLKKREGYREAFEGFDLARVASYGADDVERIFASALTIKSRPKIEAIINNAKGFVNIVQEFGSLNEYFWRHVNYAAKRNDIPDYKSGPCQSDISDAINKDLKKRGFKFIGSVTIYAFMQACGMVEDHENGCFCKSKN
ncbi:MAG: DNA-3-methyladenine glycosylase I [Epsilonproteobacteria bacterium]|nr:DNA-3-methyladenine glycosylase I [Campylobacterota bacterium]